MHLRVRLFLDQFSQANDLLKAAYELLNDALDKLLDKTILTFLNCWPILSMQSHHVHFFYTHLVRLSTKTFINFFIFLLLS